jgi:hypothetical protein
MTQLCTTIALFPDYLQTEAGVHALKQGGFDLRKLSIIGKNYHKEEHVTGVIDRGDGARYWGRFGALWASLCGVLGGSALLLFPGVGQVVILGPLVNAVLVGDSAGALAGALKSLGLPRESVERYDSAIRAGRFAVMAQGSPAEAATARRLLQATGAVEVHAHVPADDVVLRPA